MGGGRGWGFDIWDGTGQGKKGRAREATSFGVNGFEM